MSFLLILYFISIVLGISIPLFDYVIPLLLALVNSEC